MSAMYALVEIKGRQYKVEKDSLIKVALLGSGDGEEVEFSDVVMVRTDSAVNVGTPYVSGVTVKATVEGHGKNRKVIVYKHKRRKNYHRTQGHREQYTLVRVKEIAGVA